MAITFVSRSVRKPIFASIFGRRRRQRVFGLLTKHFGREALPSLTISERKFPIRVRADLQRAVELVLGETKDLVHFCGVRQEFAFEGMSIAGLLTAGRTRSPVISPPEYEETDIGEERPVRCLKAGL